MNMNDSCNLSIYYNKIWSMPVSKRKLCIILNAMLKHAPTKIGNILHVNIVDDATIAQINENYLFCHGPTNVLSFPAENTQEIIIDENIANVFFSVDTLYRECFLYKQEPIWHTIWLFAHAMGHLCNMDHSPEMDELCAIFYNVAKEIA